MQSHIGKSNSTISFYAKCGILFIMLSIFMVACATDPNAATSSLASPSATVTIQINNNNASPTPALPGYWCGAWATNTTPAYNGNGIIPVYAKLTQNVNGNPAGLGGATATAHVMWNASDVETYTTTTTSDGLAVFPVSTANKAFAVNTVTLVTVTFQKEGMPDCTVTQDHAAFFTLIHPAPKKKGDKNGNGNNNGNNNGNGNNNNGNGNNNNGNNNNGNGNNNGN